MKLLFNSILLLAILICAPLFVHTQRADKSEPARKAVSEWAVRFASPALRALDFLAEVLNHLSGAF